MSGHPTKQVYMKRINYIIPISSRQCNSTEIRIFYLFCRWSPTYDVSAILTSIQSLLSDPNPNSPANSMAAQLFKENRREYEKRVKACVEQSWCDD